MATSAKSVCTWAPQPLADSEMDLAAAEKILNELKNLPDYAQASVAKPFKAWQVDVDNDGQKEILIANEEGAEKIHHMLILRKTKGKWRGAPEMPFPFTANAEPQFLSSCGKVYILTGDGYWSIEHHKLNRICTGEELPRAEFNEKVEAGDFTAAIALARQSLDFCKGQTSGPRWLNWQHDLARTLLKNGSPALCADQLSQLKANRDFRSASLEFKATVNHDLELCSTAPLRLKVETPKPAVVVTPFPDLTPLFHVSDEDTEQSETERQQALRLKVIEATAPDVSLRHKKGGQKSFVKWLMANYKVDPDFDTKAKRFVMWRGATGKDGEDSSLVWADQEKRLSAVAVTLGLETCIVGSLNLSPKNLPIDLQEKLHDICSEATTALFYDGKSKSIDILDQVKAKPVK